MPSGIVSDRLVYMDDENEGKSTGKSAFPGRNWKTVVILAVL